MAWKQISPRSGRDAERGLELLQLGTSSAPALQVLCLFAQNSIAPETGEWMAPQKPRQSLPLQHWSVTITFGLRDFNILP